MRRQRRFLRQRRGNIVVLSVILMVGMLGMIAFAIDTGYINVARAQLQNSADAAAIAGAWKLMPPPSLTSPNNLTLASDARESAEEFAALNKVLKASPTLGEEDVQVGYIANPSDPQSPFVATGFGTPNAVQVTVRRSADQNGALALFFGGVIGTSSVNTQASATAALLSNISGFQTPSDGGNIGILPFALDQETWNAALTGGGTDNYSYNSVSQTLTPGSDGMPEMNLYPQGTGAPGNRGTVDVGGSNNSTADLARQIVYGVSAADFAALGKPLVFGPDGTLTLNGDTGISAGVKDELASIIGEPRIIPIFSQVVGPGNNATYTIVKFVGVRVLDVKLTGSMSSKRVTIQPANVMVKGAIAADNSGTSQFVYSPVWLVR
jgi:Flp pilus assembly protein TadG